MTVQLPHSSFQFLKAVHASVGNSMFGVEGVINAILIALIARGHVLLEGNPGLGKTALVRALSQALGLSEADAVGRIQFTPDLMPSDITGTKMPKGEEGKLGYTLAFEPGPIFCKLLLADEINRATPKTQAAMLEAMAEFQVTVLGTKHNLVTTRDIRYRTEHSSDTETLHNVPSPFLVMATQNPVDQEGTYPLPEAQLDRFLFKVRMPFPSRSVLAAIVEKDVGDPPKLGKTTREDRQKERELQEANERALLCIHDAGQTLRDLRPSKAVERHILNIVLASVGDFGGVEDLSDANRETLRRFVDSQVEFPLGPRAATSMTLAALGWSALTIPAGEETQIPAHSLTGLAHSVIPVLRHRLKFRTGLATFGSYSDEEALSAQHSEADQHDTLIEDFVGLCAPQEEGYAQLFAAEMNARSKEFQV